jgi:sigma-70 region 2
MEKQKIDYEFRNQLFDLHITPHLGYVYKICISHARAPDHIPELNNEVLTALLKGIMTYDPSLPALPWILTVAKRHIRKIYSKKVF